MALSHERINYNIEKIFDVVLAFNSEPRYDKLLDIILTKMMEITGSDAGTLYIVEDDKLHFRIIKNKSLGIFKSAENVIDLPPIALDKDNIENVSAYAAINNEIVTVDDVYRSHKFNFSGPRNYDRITGYRTRSMLVLPLSAYLNDETEMLGVIQLLNAVDPKTGNVTTYGNIYEPPVIPSLAKIASNVLANLTYTKEIRMLFSSIVAVMAQAIDERSAYNSHHTQNVARYCEAFAVYLKERFPPGHPYHFDEICIEQLRMAALLHDIGKITTPLHIMDKSARLGPRLEAVRYRFEIKRHQLEIDKLKDTITHRQYDVESLRLERAFVLIESANTAVFLSDEEIVRLQALVNITYKNQWGETVPLLDAADMEALAIPKGTLTASERAAMQDHASSTSRLLDCVSPWKYYKNVPVWAGSHHEFLDGTGYPKGLKGDELSKQACIITIIDIFEALTAANRPYKKSVPINEALEILANMAEKGKLHKELISLFIESGAWQTTS